MHHSLYTQEKLAHGKHVYRRERLTAQYGSQQTKDGLRYLGMVWNFIRRQPVKSKPENQHAVV